MNKETFVTLAEAYIKQEEYEDEYRDTIRSLAVKHGQETDFLGLPFGTGKIMNAVLDVLGEDFSYFFYDCHADFNKFNKGIILNDGTHPRIRSLGDLYEFAKKEGGIK